MFNAVTVLRKHFESDEPVDRADLAVCFEDMSDPMDLRDMRELQRRVLTVTLLDAKYGGCPAIEVEGAHHTAGGNQGLVSKLPPIQPR